MSEAAKEILHINIEDEMKNSYMEYAMSVIVGRALPDVRDGLKPVHRRVLYAMSELGNDWNKSYKKSARVVGDVIGKYHPHGDTAVYDTIVRMAQPFSLRYMLIDGQGNFGSVDGDAPAAMRYTEVRMSRIAHELLADLHKETVDFSLNYDESEREPNVFPTRVPNLLVNGSAGIAVGLATNIPPHNLGEVIDATLALMDNPEIEISGLLEHIPGPDFPTAGTINGASGIYQAYQTGRGRIYIRAKTHVEDMGTAGRQRLVVTELPYQVNKAVLLEKIADLVKEKRIEGISEMRDESDKDGMRMVIELKRGEMPEVLLNNLYKQTQMQNVFGINMVALIDNQPKLLNLKEILEAFVRHRQEVVTRRTIFELRKARSRAHELEGLAVALANIDDVIALIKAAPNPSTAREKLMARSWPPGLVTSLLERTGSDSSRPEDLELHFGLLDGEYHLSERQAKAILELRLHRLTGLEQEKIVKEFEEILKIIQELMVIINSHARLMEVIREELEDIRDRYADERRTIIVTTQEDLEVEDLITEEDMVVTLSHAGYVKSQPVTAYTAQKRGGRGKAATSMKDEDFIDKLFVASTHDTLLCFSSRGKVYWKKVYSIPQAGRAARGRPFVNVLPLEEGERITAVLPIREYDAEKFIFMATRRGVVKKTPLTDFSRPRTNGIIALDLRDDDELVGVDITCGQSDVMLFTDAGKAIRFNETKVRAMGRTARGVRGIRIHEDHKLISLIISNTGEAVADDEKNILIVTVNGYGKRTSVDSYAVKGRGGQGVISIQTNDRNGKVVGAKLVSSDKEVMLISNGGTLVRTRVSEISITGRNTQGVRVIALGKGETLVGLAPVDEAEEDIEDDETNSVE
ncbi:MAG: DNA gyrase subunit A [Gammaproteobacteria bacterium]|nr:DNA gyrase subunit A [Gammaproteobacteria bacterium]